jgi:hypothetical protein
MAALVPNAPGQNPLAMPAPPVASFVQLFNDPANDPLLGQYAGLFDSFAIDPAAPQASVPPQGLRDLVAAAGTQRNLVALLYINEGVSQVLLCPQRLDRALGAPPSNLYGNTYAFESDLFQNQGLNVEIPNEFFNLIPNQVLAPTAAFIQTAVAATPALEFLGPFANGDAGTEVVRVRKIIPIPFQYVNIFLASPITPSAFFTTIYPQMVIDGTDVACAAFITFFQVAITRSAIAPAPSALECNLAISPPRSEILLRLRNGLISHHFPVLSQNFAQLQQNAIATQIATFTQQTQLNRVQDEERRSTSKVDSVSKMLGIELTDKLRRVSHAATDAELSAFWHRMAATKKSARLGVFQAYIDAAKERLNEEHLTFVADNALLNATLSLSWAMVHKDAIGTGVNMFRFGDTDVEAAQQLNSHLELILSGSANPSLADATEALKTTIVLPPADGSNRNVRRYQIWSMIVLPDLHDLTAYLNSHYTDMESFRSEFAAYVTVEPHLTNAKGIYHLKYMATELTEYFKEQFRSPQPVPLPDPHAIRKFIQREQRWEPLLSQSFLIKNKVLAYCQQQYPLTFFGPPVGGPLLAGGLPLNGPPPGNPPGNGRLPARGPPLGAAPGGGAPPGGENGRTNNVGFNAELFMTYRSRPVKSASIRRQIRANTLPALPMSKVDNQTMCLAFHTKGQCNAECPRVTDHVAYTAAEYAPLLEWCAANYPAAEPQPQN